MSLVPTVGPSLGVPVRPTFVASSSGLSTQAIHQPSSVSSVVSRNLSLQQQIPQRAEGLFPTRHGVTVDRAAMENGTLRAFSLSELAQRELRVNNGLLVVGTGNTLLDTRGKELMYVMHPDRKIYVAYPQDGVYYHSSLIGLDWPIAAGMLRGRLGRLTRINENSGHFAPSRRVALVIEELRRRGAVLQGFEVIEAAPTTLVERVVMASPRERQHQLQEQLQKRCVASTVISATPNSFRPTVLNHQPRLASARKQIMVSRPGPSNRSTTAVSQGGQQRPVAASSPQRIVSVIPSTTSTFCEHLQQLWQLRQKRSSNRSHSSSQTKVSATGRQPLRIHIPQSPPSTATSFVAQKRNRRHGTREPVRVSEGQTLQGVLQVRSYTRLQPQAPSLRPEPPRGLQKVETRAFLFPRFSARPLMSPRGPQEELAKKTFEAARTRTFDFAPRKERFQQMPPSPAHRPSHTLSQPVSAPMQSRRKQMKMPEGHTFYSYAASMTTGRLGAQPAAL